MRGTEADPAPTAEEHAYFQAIEAAFLRLREKSLLLGSSDWQVAQGWYRGGIPVEIVVQVMELLFERAKQRKVRGRGISALRYFKAAVESAWEEVQSLSAGSRRERLEPIRVEERMARLAKSLPPGLSGRVAWVGRLEGLAGELEAVEARLVELDRELLTEAALALSPGETSAIDEQVERAVRRLRTRLPAPEVESSKRHLRAELVRRQLGLPHLSLFAPAARDPEASES